ncbi:hypothetical protein M422DRAFT_263772 [Sphaerobolus stellatus SS14]|uniref:Uncharacterized protein n=1 Tax=Sphaerobolus stellatus (strain SS14) TaxID=990650 RepID=A0A0C9TUU3_SPHS4|nr:hypothetical protein M422DRAFT_263772 [Sphaerobolus stellatus SS14]
MDIDSKSNIGESPSSREASPGECAPKGTRVTTTPSIHNRTKDGLRTIITLRNIYKIDISEGEDEEHSDSAVLGENHASGRDHKFKDIQSHGTSEEDYEPSGSDDEDDDCVSGRDSLPLNDIQSHAQSEDPYELSDSSIVNRDFAPGSSQSYAASEDRYRLPDPPMSNIFKLKPFEGKSAAQLEEEYDTSNLSDLESDYNAP